MSKLKNEMFAEIEKGLLDCWLENASAVINQTIAREYPEGKNLSEQEALHLSGARGLRRRELKEKAGRDFATLWENNVRPQLEQQCAVFNKEIEEYLLNRHPWLNKEESSPSQDTLKDIFIHNTTKKYLLSLLDKEKTTKQSIEWKNVLVNENTPLTWKKIDERDLFNRTQGFPLSNASFYDNRLLPSYLDAPFSSSPSRYDIYRLLKKRYGNKFQPAQVQPNLFCTRIAPLHHTELHKLTDAEWNHFQTFLVNINDEDTPQWVLLDKKNGIWTYYTPAFLQQQCETIKTPEKCQIRTVDSSDSIPYKDTLTDWHAVLFSRVLPWSQQEPLTNLQTYRATVPVSLLFQNTLEETCLPAQKKYEQASKKAFSKRLPLSQFSEQAIYSDSKDPTCLLKNIPETSAITVIKAFEDKHIAYTPQDRQLTMTDKFQIEAMKLVYYHHIKKLTMTAAPEESLKSWFEYNLELTTIHSENVSKGCGYAHACAARNRFLADIKPDYHKTVDARQTAWQNTGLFIYDILKNQTDKTQSKNIAEMGDEGLTVLFNHLKTLTTAANLSCTLDLDSGKTLEAREYIQSLKNNIESYRGKKPLFSKLTLVLPTQLNESTDAFLDLISTLNASGEIKEVYFENTAVIDASFLNAFDTLVENEEKNIRLQIKIPAWDDTKCVDEKTSPLKAQYRELQNKILTNIRKGRSGVLAANTHSIEKPSVAFPLKTKNKPIIETDTSWRENITYTLDSAVSVGVQQQAQQEVAQQAQQEAEQQSQPPKPVAREIEAYTGDESKLVTRDNLNEHGLDEETFSSWVGSRKRGTFVIQKIDQAALAKLREFDKLFTFAIDGENTAGFRLYYSPTDKTRILTYDAKLEAEDIAEKKLDPLSKPFAMQMNKPQPATPFCGDYRQFKTLADSNNTQEEMTLWHDLATETVPDDIKDWLRSQEYSHLDTSESIQHYNILPGDHAVAVDTDLKKMLSILQKKWPHITNNEFWSALLDKWTENNQRAFGQLFYHYDTAGSKHWIDLAHEIYTKFPKKWSIFKQRILDPLDDWSECLEKSEVDALTTSMKKLDGHKDYQDVLWALIDEHGKNVGPMRYAEIWEAYDEVIKYINANDLHIDPNQFRDTIAKYPGKFNATQFLRRLSSVLQHTGNRQDSPIIQQEILDNLSNIDWREDGFYYACVHENYHYWDESLAFHDLEALDGGKIPSYIATWKDDLVLANITNPVSYTLRYAAQKLKLNKSDFDNFKNIILNVSEQCSNSKNQIELMRLITASIALGFDTIDELQKRDWRSFNDDKYHAGLQLINKQLHLDSKELIGQSYHVRIANLPMLLDTLQEASIDPEKLDLDAINALGRASQYYKEDKKSLETLIKNGAQYGFDHPLITAYPWLDSPIEITNTNPEQSKFYKQLSSIDFSKNNQLPKKEELNEIVNRIHSKETRDEAVTQLIAQGCHITDQDADFRLITNHEKQKVDDLFLAKTFQAENRKLLKQLFDRLAIKQEGDTNQKIQRLLSLFSTLGRKSYYDELGPLLSVLLEKSKGEPRYSLEQLTIFLESVFDENAFKTRPYPVEFINALLDDALNDDTSGLLSQNLRQLQIRDPRLESLKTIMERTNLSDLSAQAKQTLVEVAIQFKYSTHLEQTVSRLNKIFERLKHAPHVTSSLCNLMLVSLEENSEIVFDMLEKVTSTYSGSDEKLKILWESTQIKLLDGLKTKSISHEKANKLASISDPSIRMILIEALSESDDINLINQVQQKLSYLAPADKEKLARYYTSMLKPTLTQLDKLIANRQASCTQIIRDFKTKIQAVDSKTGKSKRHYSVDKKDAEGIQRVLAGFKLKQQQSVVTQSEQAELLRLLYYANTYSHVMQFEAKANNDLDALYDELRGIIHENVTIISSNGENIAEAKARILACMREVVFLETGKWVNHTQMIDLLYSALHDDDNLLHQVHTGEGKSLITLMRVAYRALNGQIVDVFSSKDSLSRRDHQASLAVLDVLGIYNTHITANSKANEYRNKVNSKGVGSVHFSTVGSWSLFLSGLRWEDRDSDDYIDMYAANRVVFLDEGDHIMLAEDTLFNYSDQTESSSLFNLDAWVYQATYDFYEKHMDEFAAKKFAVSENPDLMNLYLELQKKAQEIAPPESSFFQKYLASGDETLRNQKLAYLLKAAHQAKKLKENVDFCVMDEQKKLGETATLNIHVAKVMINNQIAHGSTYSDLVQQFLCVRLKKEGRGTFFIEPESEIALSLDAPYVLKHYYKRIEACTGTPGNKDTLKRYKDEFDIQRIIKLPTHQEIRTKFLAPIYCDDETAQINAIVASIKENPNQPILITCEDDKAVKRLGELIEQALAAAEITRPLAIDTNAKGLSEADILEKAGQPFALTISSRLGRGSDIKPYSTDVGLKVIRTYAAIPSIVKQEQGRQGRNNAYGECQDIINYDLIQEELKKYEQFTEFKTLLNDETIHLDAKLKKHEELKKENKVIWKDIKENTDLKTQYLNTRTLQQYKHNEKEAEKKLTREKDSLFIEGTAQFMSHLRTLLPSEKVVFKEKWKECRNAMEAKWTTDNGVTSRGILDAFYNTHGIPIPTLPEENTSHDYLQDDKEMPIQELMAFHQNWLKSLYESGFNPAKAVTDALYGEKSEHLDALYQIFETLNATQLQALSGVVEKHPACHTIDCQSWCEVIAMIKEDSDNLQNYEQRLSKFFKENPSFPKNVEDVVNRGQSFIAKIRGTPDIEFLEKIIKESHFQEEDRTYLSGVVKQFPIKIVALCQDHMQREDVVLLLKLLVKFKAQDKSTDRLIGYFTEHIGSLEKHADTIRPLMPLLLKNNPTIAGVLQSLEYNHNTAALLCFLNQRPSFDNQDYLTLQEKINRIAEENQNAFLISLSNLPPYLSVKNVLLALDDLPGKHSFTGSGQIELQSHIKQIHAATTAFNEFLFDHDIISDGKKFDDIQDENQYNEWQVLFVTIPLNKRETLFTALKPLKHLNINDLKPIVETYALNLKNETLYEMVHERQHKQSSQLNTTSTDVKVTSIKFFDNNHVKTPGSGPGTAPIPGK